MLNYGYKKVGRLMYSFPSSFSCCWIRDPGMEKFRIRDSGYTTRIRKTDIESVLIIRHVFEKNKEDLSTTSLRYSVMQADLRKTD